MISVNNFIDQLTYFGAALSGEPKRFSTRYIDLEEFVLEATLHLSMDTRATQAFVLWVKRYGCLLSPSKLRRLIRGGTSFEPSILGVVVDLIVENSNRLQSWEILKPFTQKRKNQSLFPHLPKPNRNLNLVFFRRGWIAPPLDESEQKYLLAARTVFDRCPELRFRAEGVSPVAADIRAWVQKNPRQSGSLYHIAKVTHHPRAQINGFYRQLASLQIVEPLSTNR